MRRLRLISILPLLLLAAGGFLFYRAFAPYQGFAGQTFVDIPRGTSTEGIAELLAQAGVVRSRWDFWVARVFARGRVLEAGEYRFNRAASPVEVYGRIARGDVFYYELVVPEGRNMFDIGTAVEQLGLFPASRFLAAARDPALIRDLDSAGARSRRLPLPQHLPAQPPHHARGPLPHHDRQIPRGVELNSKPARTCTARSRWLRSSRRKPGCRPSGRKWPGCSGTACAWA